jgi:hypothetical protein
VECEGAAPLALPAFQTVYKNVVVIGQKSC